MAAGTFETARRGALRIVGLELVLTLLAGLMALPWGVQAAGSALAGGLINVLASGYMARRIFAGGLAAGPRAWLARLWLAEIVKFGLTVALFAFAIGVLKAAFLPLILAYMATYAAYW
ncbi:MAG TPA: ATP synthase subunit I, partial [Gammaproteobacteria bacterium]|nr:ATP synthase subunit I [Gammaproteobacteria bacterium]